MPPLNIGPLQAMLEGDPFKHLLAAWLDEERVELDRLRRLLRDAKTSEAVSTTVFASGVVEGMSRLSQVLARLVREERRSLGLPALMPPRSRAERTFDARSRSGTT